jgi:hypothetical protein
VSSTDPLQVVLLLYLVTVTTSDCVKVPGVSPAGTVTVRVKFMELPVWQADEPPNDTAAEESETAVRITACVELCVTVTGKVTVPPAYVTAPLCVPTVMPVIEAPAGNADPAMTPDATPRIISALRAIDVKVLGPRSR